MAHPNEDLVREGFAAFERGDMDYLQKHFWAEDIRWHTPGRSPLAGDYEGTEQVTQVFARLADKRGYLMDATTLTACGLRARADRWSANAALVMRPRWCAGARIPRERHPCRGSAPDGAP